MISAPANNSSDRIRPRLLVVGNGPVGFAFCEQLVSRGGTERFDVTVVGEEAQPAYDRVNLTSRFAGRTEQDLLLADRSWYEQSGITLRTGEKVVAVDRRNRMAVTDSDETLPFDQLILATGSSAFVPPIPGTDLPGVFVYRTLEDVNAISKAVVGKRSAIVIGGGLLGLEAAKVLHDAGLRTTVVELAPALMSRQLDTGAAQTLLQQVTRMGVAVELQKRTTAITQAGDQLQLEINHGEPIEADLIVFSVGIRPRDELAKSCGLQLGDRGGVAIQHTLQTSDPDIYAIGECASHDGTIYGLYGPGFMMADVLARRLTGEGATFTGADFSARLKLMGVEVATIADFLQPDHEAEVWQADGIYRKLLFDGRRLVGAILVGPCPERPRLEEAIQSGRRISARRRRYFHEHGQLWAKDNGLSVHEWPEDAIVCTCRTVRRGALTDLCASGCESVEALGQECGAGTVCGSCQPLLSQLLGQQSEAVAPTGMLTLATASVVAILATAAFVLFGPVSYADSVRDSLHEWTALWSTDFWKQVTGFTLVGLMVISLGLSLRKRFAWFRLGDYGIWRAIHGFLGATTVVGVIVHTGGKFGSNLNFLLLSVFLSLNVLGAVTAIAVSRESKLQMSGASFARVARPWLTRMHIWLFWPLPVLLLFHILTVYYY